MNQFKKSEDLDIYEMDYSNNTHLQEVCEIRQPILFQFQHKLFQDISPKNIAKYGSYDVKIKDTNDYYNNHSEKSNDADKKSQINSVDSVTLSLNSTIKLLENDTSAHFISENNDDFLEETGQLRNIQTVDPFLKPVFNIYTKYDLLFGSQNAVTPLRYHNYYRQFLCITSGKIHIKMTPWKSSKYLTPVKDYENYEFRSPVHPTKPLAQYINDFEKTKFLEFDVKEGYVLYIPPYWWYSIQYIDPATFACSISYSTVMNCVSNLPDLGLYWLQQQNITKKITTTTPPSLSKNDENGMTNIDNTNTDNQNQTIIPFENSSKVDLETVQSLPEIKLDTVQSSPEIKLDTVQSLPEIKLDIVQSLPEIKLAEILDGSNIVVTHKENTENISL